MTTSESVAQSYEAPTSVEEAQRLTGAQARPFAGGTDLLVQVRAHASASASSSSQTFFPPARLVDLKRIPELMSVTADDKGVRIGAACSSARLREQAEKFARFPGLLEACALIGSDQIQERASVGGNLCNASPAADTVPALLVNEAACEVAGRAGRRFVPAREFCKAPGVTILGADELLVALHLPPPPARSADAYLRLTPRSEMDIAVAGAAARVELDADGRIANARLALGAVGPVAFEVAGAGEALRGATPDAGAFARAAALAAAAATPISDKRGTAEYRREIAGVLARRALATAAARVASAS